jgi:hypothetical protein
MAGQLRNEDFAPHVGKRFRFQGWHSALRLAMIDVPHHAGMPGATRAPFTLIFHGAVDDILPEGLYRADVEDGPSFEIYVMPIHTTAPGRQEYQAVFN